VKGNDFGDFYFKVRKEDGTAQEHASQLVTAQRFPQQIAATCVELRKMEL